MGVRQNEKFSETKKRLQARIGVSDKDLAKFRFALIQVATFKQPSHIEDGMKDMSHVRCMLHWASRGREGS